MTKAPFLFASVLSACTVTGTAPPHAAPTTTAAMPVVASIAYSGASILDLAADQLMSRATISREDERSVCFDVVLRLPNMGDKAVAAGLIERPFDFAVEIDGVASTDHKGRLADCRDVAACLPDGSVLLPFVAEPEARVTVQAGRLCFDGTPRARREIALSSAKGLGTYRFRFPIEAAEARAATGL